MPKKVRDFILNPIVLATISLFTILVIGAGLLWALEICYAHPGPAIAGAGLAVVILVAGLVINDLQAKKDKLSQKVDALKERPERLPRIIGLELLVERWKTFNPGKYDKNILNEQFSIALSIAQLEYHNLDEIRFGKYFSGAKIKGGAFILQTGPNRKPLVLKFDSWANILREIESYEHCVKQYLMNTPGEPLHLEQRRGRIDNQEWGAIAYSLVAENTGKSITTNDLRQLQTFGQYYRAHSGAEVEDALTKICVVLEPWWTTQRQWPAIYTQGGPRDLYDEYERLTRKLDDMKKGLAEAGEALPLKPLESIKKLRLCNPLQWVENIFNKRNLGRWIEVRLDSIVHGDCHAGNILVTLDEQGKIIQPWIIDFPHAHVGPTVQDIARLEADIKFGLFPEELLKQNFDKQNFSPILAFEKSVLGDNTRRSLDLHKRPRPQVYSASGSSQEKLDAELDKVWQALAVLRERVRNSYLGVNDARPYYLALLHASLPVLYYRDRSPWQKLYAFISAALLCERLND